MLLGSPEDRPSSCPVLEIRWKSFEIRSSGEWWLIIVLMTRIRYCPEFVNTPIPSFCRGILDDKNKIRKNGWRSLFGKKSWEHIFFKPCPTQTLQKRVYLSFLLWPNATAFKWFCYARHSVYTKTKKRHETKQKHPNDQSFYRALLDASNALNPECSDYLHYLILSGWQLVKSVALPANPVVRAKISGELFDFMRVHSLEHVSTQVNGM